MPLLRTQKSVSGLKKSFKYLGFIVLAFVAVFILLAVISPVGRSFIFYYWMGLKAQWLQERAEKAILNDKFGGKTPQETIDLYLDALRKGDVELAAKYIFKDPIDPRRWETYRDYLAELKKNNLLDEYLTKWDKIEQEKESEIEHVKKLVEAGMLDESWIEIELKRMDSRMKYHYSVWQEAGVDRFEYPDGTTQEAPYPAGYYDAQFSLAKNPEPNNLWKFSEIPL